MIKVSGEAERAFSFPADIEKAFVFFSDIPRLIGYLPHITLVSFDPDGRQLRVRYASTELGTYVINIVSDLEYEIDLVNYLLTIRAVDRLPAIKPQTTINSTTARGYFNCRARFFLSDDGNEQETHLEYALTMEARLPKPGGLRFMPGRVIAGLVSGITKGRIKEIADGFVENAVRAYREQTLEEV